MSGLDEELIRKGQQLLHALRRDVAILRYAQLELDADAEERPWLPKPLRHTVPTMLGGVSEALAGHAFRLEKLAEAVEKWLVALRS